MSTEDALKNNMAKTRRYLFPHLITWSFLGFLLGILLLEVKKCIWIPLFGMIWLWLAADKERVIKYICIALIFCVAGMGNMERINKQKEKVLADYDIRQNQLGYVAGTVVKHQQDTGYLWLKSGKELIHVQLNNKEKWYPCGSKMEIKGMFLLPESANNPGGFDQKQWLQQNGIFRIMRATEVQVKEEPKGQYYWSKILRERAMQVVEMLFTEKQQQVLRALLFGEKYRLDKKLYRIAQQMGIAHVFSVSGLHVGLIVGAMLFAMRLIKMENNWGTIIIIGGFLYGYCLLIGFPASAIRATVMVLLAMIGRKLLGPLVPLEFLSAIGLALLMNNPFLLWSVGFQLSFGVTAGLIVFTGVFAGKLQSLGIPRKIANPCGVVMAAWLTSTPIMMGNYYVISFLSPVMNLLLVPLLSWLVPLLFFMLMLSCVCFPLGKMMAIPMKWGVDFALNGFELLAECPVFYQWNLGHYTNRVLPGWGIIMILLWLLLSFETVSKRKKQPLKFIFLGAITGCAIGMIILMMPETEQRDKITFLYAEQGSCAVLQTATHECYIFDCGASETELLYVLRWMGVNRVDGIVLSHLDSDHIAGLEAVSEALSIRKIFISEGQYQRLQTGTVEWNVQHLKKNVAVISENTLLHTKKGFLKLFPAEQEIVSVSEKQNSGQLGAVYMNDDYVIAFPGDMTAEEAERFVSISENISVWVVPHHGSRYSASAKLFQILKQKKIVLAIISAGKNNRYGHPHAETIQGLSESGILFRQTCEEGAITVYL